MWCFCDDDGSRYECYMHVRRARASYGRLLIELGTASGTVDGSYLQERLDATSGYLNASALDEHHGELLILIGGVLCGRDFVERLFQRASLLGFGIRDYLGMDGCECYVSLEGMVVRHTGDGHRAVEELSIRKFIYDPVFQKIFWRSRILDPVSLPKLYFNMPRLTTFCATALSLAALAAGANEYSSDQLQNGMKFITPQPISMFFANVHRSSLGCPGRCAVSINVLPLRRQIKNNPYR
jgi:hypothetical protein